jgi:hypothetical protein
MLSGLVLLHILYFCVLNFIISIHVKLYLLIIANCSDTKLYIQLSGDLIWKYCNEKIKTILGGSSGAGQDKKNADVTVSNAPFEVLNQDPLPLPLMRMEAPKYLISGLKRYVVPSASKLTSLISSGDIGLNNSGIIGGRQLGTAAYSAGTTLSENHYHNITSTKGCLRGYLLEMLTNQHVKY